MSTIKYEPNIVRKYCWDKGYRIVFLPVGTGYMPDLKMVLLMPGGSEKINHEVIIKQKKVNDFESKVNLKYERLYEYLLRHG